MYGHIVCYVVSSMIFNIFALIQLPQQERSYNEGNQPDKLLRPTGKEPHVLGLFIFTAIHLDGRTGWL